MNTSISYGYIEGGKLWFGLNVVSHVKNVWGNNFYMEVDDFPFQEVLIQHKPIGKSPIIQIRSEDRSKQLGEIQWRAQQNQIKTFYIEVDCLERGGKIGRVIMSIFLLWARIHKIESISAHSTPKNDCPENEHPPMSQAELNNWYEGFGFEVDLKNNSIFLNLT